MLPQQWQTVCLIPETGGERGEVEGGGGRGGEVKLKPSGSGEHMQLKATGVRRQKLQKDTERREGGGVHVRESC